MYGLVHEYSSKCPLKKAGVPLIYLVTCFTQTKLFAPPNSFILMVTPPLHLFLLHSPQLWYYLSFSSFFLLQNAFSELF